jgi:uncharacterized protein GlcG (DUF336 family)
MIEQHSISLAEAEEIVAAALAKADEIGSPSNVAVVDSGGNLLAFARMDKAWLGSIDIAISKAYTSRAFDLSTRELAGLAKPGSAFYGIQESNHGKINILPGGVPLKSKEAVVGAVGVSGGTGEQDQQIAEAAAKAVRL